MSEEATYTFAAVAQILAVPESKLRYWSQVGFVGPSIRRGGKQLFTFQDLVSVKAAKELIERGFKAGQIRKALDTVRTSLPHLDRPLERIRVAFNGEMLVVVDDGNAYEVSGQKVFDFGLSELAHRVAEVTPMALPVGAPATAIPTTEAAVEPASPPRRAYDWFVEGARLERECADLEGAAGCYRKALELDRGLAAAHTNLGNLAYRGGDFDAARASFEAALALDPEQPEARFNLANMVLESGDLELAVVEFRRVLQSDPDFADAHYNLAIALERLGGRMQARAHLERYLALGGAESSPWVTEAKQLIARLAD